MCDYVLEFEKRARALCDKLDHFATSNWYSEYAALRELLPGDKIMTSGETDRAMALRLGRELWTAKERIPQLDATQRQIKGLESALKNTCENWEETAGILGHDLAAAQQRLEEQEDRVAMADQQIKELQQRIAELEAEVQAMC